MTRVREQQQVTGEHAGVVVSGRRLRVDGSPDTDALRFTPEHDALVNGVVYSAVAIEVTPDGDGRFTVTLAPSSAVGPYMVQLARRVVSLVVPDAGPAAFDDCVVRDG